MSLYTIATFYKFTPLPDYESMKESLLAVMREQAILGTIILALEGVNGTFCGHDHSVVYLENYLRTHAGLEDLSFCKTHDDLNPFTKAKVKLRKEIVTLGTPDANPLALTGTHLTPEQWNELLQEPDVVVIDTRNDYEVKLGQFKDAINPKTDNFRDFPDYVEKHLLDKKDRKIAMYCTGGIRCEKSTSYLKKLGFKQVYQLQGGILNYLETIPANASKWEGQCFVFDERVALEPSLKSLAKGSIDTEWKNKNRQKAVEPT